MDEPQAAWAMTTRMPPSFQVMSIPVSTLAANEMAARVSMNTPALTPTPAAKAAKRDAKPAYVPCRLSRMTAGAPEGGVSPARAVIAPRWATAGRAGRAGRCPGRGGKHPQYGRQSPSQRPENGT